MKFLKFSASLLILFSFSLFFVIPARADGYCASTDSCTSYGDPTQCGSKIACTWNYSISLCQPKTNTCSSITIPGTCNSTSGCSWTSVNSSGPVAPTPPPPPPPTNLENPLDAITSPQLLIGKVIDSVLGIVGSIALLMFIFGGFTWMTSAGSADKIKKGKDIIVWSAIGLIIIFASYGLVRFLILSIK